MSTEYEANYQLGIHMVGMTTSGIHPLDENEDSIFYSAQRGLAMVLDGVGGMPSDKLVSTKAKDFILQNEPGVFSLYSNWHELAMRALLTSTSDYIRSNTEAGGTTATVVKVISQTGERTAVIGQVGNSRVYSFKDNRLKRLTQDDSLVFYTYPVAEAEEITQKLDEVRSLKGLKGLPPDLKRLFRQRHMITQVLGDRQVYPHTKSITLSDGEILLLLTDGIHKNLTSSEIAKKTALSRFDQLPNTLATAAFQRSLSHHLRAYPDDFSAVALQYSLPESERLEGTFFLSRG